MFGTHHWLNHEVFMKLYRADQLESLRVEQVFRASNLVACLVALSFWAPMDMLSRYIE